MTEISSRMAIATHGSIDDDDPSRDIRGGQLVLGGFLGLLLLWASITPLDAAATASGQISVSGHNQVVQHREGGVVAAVDVVEGQGVRAGQVLVELAPEDVGAQVRALRAQQISLEAQRARLLAEVEERSTIVWPDSFGTLAGDDLLAAQEAMKSQQAQFAAGLAALNDQQATLARNAAGLRQQIEGSRGQLESVDRQQVLLDQQLQGVRSLAARGFASQNSVRVLERNAADLSGARAQQAANVGDYRQQVAQAVSCNLATFRLSAVWLPLRQPARDRGSTRTRTRLSWRRYGPNWNVARCAPNPTAASPASRFSPPARSSRRARS